MKVRMKSQVSGVRDGKAWPAVGETVDVSADEGKSLCESGLAEPADSRGASEENAQKTETVEYRAEGIAVEDLPVDESGVHYNDKPAAVGVSATQQAPKAAKKSASKKA